MDVVKLDELVPTRLWGETPHPSKADAYVVEVGHLAPREAHFIRVLHEHAGSLAVYTSAPPRIRLL